METLFPQILFLGPMFVPFVLRIAAAISFALMAKTFYETRKQMTEARFPFIGKVGMSVVWFGILVAATMAALLAVGLWTQAAAILGVVASCKGWYWTRTYPWMYPYGRLAYFLLIMISLSLIATGAGVIAFDKPY